MNSILDELESRYLNPSDEEVSAYRMEQAQARQQDPDTRGRILLDDAALVHEPKLSPEEARAQLAAIAQQYGMTGLDIAKTLSGYDAVTEGAGDIYRATQADPSLESVGRGVLGAGKMAVGAMPGSSLFRAGRAALKPLFKTGTRTGMTLGGSMLPWSLGDVMDIQKAKAADGKPMRLGTTDEAEIAARLSKMGRDQIRSYQEMIGVKPDGVAGSDTISEALRYENAMQERAQAEAAKEQEKERLRLDAELKRELEKTRIEAETAAKIKELEAAAAAARKKKEDDAVTPTRKLYPEYMPLVLPAALFGAGVAGGRVGRHFAKRYADDIDDIVQRWGTEAGRKNPRANYMNAYKDDYDKVVAARDKFHPMQELGEFAAGGTVGAHVAMAPEIMDVLRGVPDASKHLTDWDTLYRVGMEGVGGGAVGHLAGTLTRGKIRANTTGRQYRAETNALNNGPNTPKGPQTPPGGNTGPGSSGTGGTTGSPPNTTQGPQGPQGPGSGGTGGKTSGTSTSSVNDKYTSKHTDVSRAYMEELQNSRSRAAMALKGLKGKKRKEAIADALNKRFEAAKLNQVDRDALIKRYDTTDAELSALKATNAKGGARKLTNKFMVGQSTGKAGQLGIAGAAAGGAGVVAASRDTKASPMPTPKQIREIRKKNPRISQMNAFAQAWVENGGPKNPGDAAKNYRRYVRDLKARQERAKKVLEYVGRDPVSGRFMSQ